MNQRKAFEFGKDVRKPLNMVTQLNTIRKFIFGKEADKGIIFKFFIYLILIDTAYIYLKPIFYIIVTMLKGEQDQLNPAVTWVPTVISFEYLKLAYEGLDFVKSFMVSLTLSFSSAILQVVSCAIAGYAFARLQFPFKRTLFIFLLFTFLMPLQLTILPMMIVYTKIGWFGTYWPIIFPALFGHGLKGALFVIIFRQFFSTQPKELDEAAKVDGANAFTVFYKVMLPLAKPAILVVFLFSFVWHWNDAYLTGMYMSWADVMPLSLVTNILSDYLIALQEEPPTGTVVLFPEPIRMAAYFLGILPPLILYMFAQRWFVEGVERTGLVE